jgi:hypothetical protein
MKYALVLKEEAAQETIEAFLWYEVRSLGLGESFLEELEECYNRVVQHPESFQKQYKDFRHAQLKRFPFVVIFEVEEYAVIVYKVFHTSRNPRLRYRRKRK